MEEDIVYQLVEEDLQMVAEQTIGRRLDKNEIESLKDPVANNINWYDAIEAAINDIIPDDQ